MDWKEMAKAKGGEAEHKEEAPHVECPKCGHQFARGGEVEEEEEFRDPLDELEQQHEEEGTFMQALRKLRPGIYDTKTMIGPRRKY